MIVIRTTHYWLVHDIAGSECSDNVHRFSGYTGPVEQGISFVFWTYEFFKLVELCRIFWNHFIFDSLFKLFLPFSLMWDSPLQVGSSRFASEQKIISSPLGPKNRNKRKRNPPHWSKWQKLKGKGLSWRGVPYRKPPGRGFWSREMAYQFFLVFFFRRPN